MKKLVALILAAMMLCASLALAEAPEGYPEVPKLSKALTSAARL